jgi:Ca-activated chloride channel homolog
MDSSGSMKADDGSGQPKIAAAKVALNGLVDSLDEDVLVGLRVYGHRVPNTDKARGCKDTELIVPVGPLDKGAMKAKVRSFQAKGFTPIGLSLKKGAADLRGQEGKRTIVLVSDGIDTCAPPPPCKIARQITGQGIDLRIDTIGFQVDPKARAELRCIARVAGGDYYDAGSAQELADRLQQLSVRALRTYETVGEPVEGTTVPEAAPVLGTGQFTDTITPGESLYYAVEVAPGQSVEASATLVGDRTKPRAKWGKFEFQLLDPDVQWKDGDSSFDVGRQPRSVGVTGDTATGDDLHPAGTYYLRVGLVDSRSELGTTEFPVELSVNVIGDAITPTPDDGAASVDGDAAPRAAPPANDSNPATNPVAALGGGAVFGLLGAWLGAAGVRRLTRG